MKNRAITILLFPLGLLLAVLLFYLALGWWLDSAGGRRAVERALGEQLGAPVSLQGEFDLSLPPRAGVRGTRLLVLDPQSGQAVVSSGQFEVVLALRPLLREEVHVTELTVTDIEISSGEGGPAAFFAPGVSVTGMAPGHAARFRADLGAYGEATGSFTWHPARQQIELQIDWGGLLFPRIALDTVFQYTDGIIAFEPVELAVNDQLATGHGCLLIGDVPEINLVLHAELINLDSLGGGLPGGASGNGAMPFDLNFRLSIDETRQGDARAFGTVLEWGRDPDCPGR